MFVVISISDPGFHDQQFATHTISYTVNYPQGAGVIVKKDNVSETALY
jgi:hypothetical protein